MFGIFRLCTKVFLCSHPIFHQPIKEFSRSHAIGIKIFYYIILFPSFVSGIALCVSIEQFSFISLHLENSCSELRVLLGRFFPLMRIKGSFLYSLRTFGSKLIFFILAWLIQLVNWGHLLGIFFPSLYSKVVCVFVPEAHFLHSAKY